MTTCRNCAAKIKPCNCGANNGRPHWIDDRSSRWCSRGVGAGAGAWARSPKGPSMSAKHDPDQDPYCLDSSHDDLAAQVSSLTAENERLRKELARSEAEWAGMDELLAEANQNVLHWQERALDAERTLARAQPVLEAAKKWRDYHGIPEVASKWLHGAIHGLIAAVDALPPTPPATEEIDD